MSHASDSFERLYGIVARLRGPGGCPWDREQTPASLRGNVIEEAYELVESIDEGEAHHIREEIGDLFLMATMLAYIYEESGSFSVSDSLKDIGDKLLRRHPHVFGDAKLDSSEAVLAQWADIKVNVEGKRKKDSLLDEVSKALPPLERAYKIQKKAAKAGFDWKTADDVVAKVEEELAEVAEARAGQSRDELEGELGDLLYSVINLSRFLGVDPTLALHRTNEKFSRRFRHVEKSMAAEGKPMTAEHMERMDAFWDEAKGLEAKA